VIIRPAGKYWVASSPAFDIATQGETFEIAEKNFQELLCLFVESCFLRGTLAEVLRQAGYTETQAESAVKAAATFFPHSPQREYECRA